MNINKQFDEMFALYQQRATAIMSQIGTSGQTGTTAENDPVKMDWARKEGFQEHYDPNSNEVVWTQQPQPAYDLHNLLKVRGSMSPETFAESFPEYQIKAEKLDESLTAIYQDVLDGKITQQRGEELCFQLMDDTYKEAIKNGKPKGAGVKSSSEKQTADKASAGKKIVGE